MWNAKIMFLLEQICLSLALRAVVEINLLPPHRCSLSKCAQNASRLQFRDYLTVAYFASHEQSAAKNTRLPCAASTSRTERSASAVVLRSALLFTKAGLAWHICCPLVQQSEFVTKRPPPVHPPAHTSAPFKCTSRLISVGPKRERERACESFDISLRVAHLFNNGAACGSMWLAFSHLSSGLPMLAALPSRALCADEIYAICRRNILRCLQPDPHPPSL